MADASTVFAGEVGGLMGLLIGGSLLSLVELVDVIFYNGFCKLIYLVRGDNSKSDDEEEDDDSKAEKGGVSNIGFSDEKMPLPPDKTNYGVGHESSKF